MIKFKRIIDGYEVYFFTNTLNPEPGQIPMFFIHGVGGDYHGFVGLARELTDMWLIFIELPGQGGESPAFTDRLHSAQNYAEIVVKYIEQENLNNVIMVGHSFGAAVAIIASSIIPSRVKQLILLAPFFGSNTLGAQLTHVYFKLCTVLPYPFNHYLASNKFLIWLSEYMYLTTSDKKLRDKVTRRDRITMSKMYPPALGEINLTYKNIDFASCAEKIACECLLIYGDKDSLAPVSTSTAFAAMFNNSIVEVVKGANHLLQLEQPETIANIIKAKL